MFMKKAKAGFSLVELMVVVVILGIFMIIAVPNYLNQAWRAKERKALFNLKQMGFKNPKANTVGIVHFRLKGKGKPIPKGAIPEGTPPAKKKTGLSGGQHLSGAVARTALPIPKMIAPQLIPFRLTCLSI